MRRMLRGIDLRLHLVLGLLCCSPLSAQVLQLPDRPPGALTGSALVEALGSLDLGAREARLYREIASGNLPTWLRRLVPVTMSRLVNGRRIAVTFHATPDYLAVGSDTDYFLMPLSPQLAQRIADLTGTSLPTPAMVDAIWQSATVRLGPDSIPPSAAMITVPVFAEHNRLVRARRDRNAAPPGALVAGHKKDVVLSSRLDTLTNRVAIYGWHKPDGQPIQPLNTWHTTGHVDYSHGIRLVSRRVLVDGVTHDLVEMLGDAELASLLNDEGIAHPYPTTHP